MRTLTGHSGLVQSVAFSRDAKLIASGSSDELVKIWNAETGALVSSFVGVRRGWRDGRVTFRAFPTGSGLREGSPGEWRMVMSRL